MRSWRSWIGWLRPKELPASLQNEPKDLPSDSGWSLRIRLLVTVTIALLPIAVWSVLQGIDRANHEVIEARERLVQTAQTAATPEQNMLASAEQVLRALANMTDVRDASPDCDHDLAQALRGVPFFVNIARLDSKGTVICAAIPAALGQNASRVPIWGEAARSSNFVVSNEMKSPVNGQRVIAGILPLRDGRGAFQGALAIGLDVRWLDSMIHANNLPKGSVVALLDRQGAIISSNKPELASTLFHRPTISARSAISATKDKANHDWIYATAPLVGQNVFIGFAMRESNLLGSTYVDLGTDFLLPFLMIALSWIAIWVVTERQSTRWIVYLRRFSAAYRAGHYSARPVLDGAPAEFRQLGEALAAMADSIQERDRRLREAVEQKTVLIREIHHRVKNNLQIVMSLLSLQAGRLRDPAAQEALRQARARINALALVHRILYEIEDQTNVDIKRLVQDLAEQTHEGFGGDRNDVRVSVDAIARSASSDVAVPLALFTVEALTNAFKHAFPPSQEGGAIRVSLESLDGGKLRLSVEDDGIGFDESSADKSIGARLIGTFGLQIGGAASMRSQEGKGTVAEIVFPDPGAASGPAN